MRIPERFWLGALVGLGLAILAVAVFGDQGLREVRRLRRERLGLAEEKAALQARRDSLAREIEALRSNPRAVEERARRDLGMIRKGETVFLLPEQHAPRH